MRLTTPPHAVGVLALFAEEWRNTTHGRGGVEMLESRGFMSFQVQWGTGHDGAQPHIHITWEAELTIHAELCLRFIRSDDPSVLLTEDISLGDQLLGNRTFGTSELGFDLSVEPWALMLYRRPIARGIDT